MLDNNILDNLEEKSEAFNKLMDEPPKFYLRSGFGIMAGFLILLFAGATFIKYPDYISSEVKIISVYPRAPIVSNVNGRILNLTPSNTNVEAMEVIGEIENPALTRDVLKLEKSLTVLNLDSIYISDFYIEESLVLGDLQPSFSNFIGAKNELDIYLNIKSNTAKVSSLYNELNSNTAYINSLEEERKNLEEKLSLAESQLNRNKALYEKGVISLNDFEISKQRYVDIENDYQSKISHILQVRLNSQKIKSSLSSTSKENDEDNLRLFAVYRNALNQLKSDIEAWKKRYLLISPIEGKLILNNVWASQQMTVAGNEIGSIIPIEEEIFALAKMPEFESGKAKIDSDVLIYLNSYNFSEFGIIKGKTRSISPIPYDGYYNVEISLPNQLITDSKFNIPFTPELSGEARIITEDLNLLQKIFYKLKKLFKKQKKFVEKDTNIE